MSTYSTGMQQSKDRRIRIKDDSREKTVSITMTDLKAEDSGTYFCAIYKGAYVSLRTISLNVFRGEYLSPTQIKVLSGSNIIPSPALPPLPHS